MARSQRTRDKTYDGHDSYEKNEQQGYDDCCVRETMDNGPLRFARDNSDHEDGKGNRVANSYNKQKSR